MFLGEKGDTCVNCLGSVNPIPGPQGPPGPPGFPGKTTPPKFCFRQVILTNFPESTVAD